MKIKNKHYTSLWFTDETEPRIFIIDQRKLPFEFEILELRSLDDGIAAIKNMAVRGAPLIGVTASFSLYLALRASSSVKWKTTLFSASERLIATRPTAVNLAYAINRSLERARECNTILEAQTILLQAAKELWEYERHSCKAIGEYGVRFIKDAYKKTGKPVNILTHCNAGWLACVDYGTATAPIYEAQKRGIPVHVWVDETRPRNQGSFLTAWEMQQQGIPHTVIVDNVGGLLMAQGKVDLCLVGSDRTSVRGDVANKIGTYLKALAAFDNNIPFLVALPSSTIDLHMTDAFTEMIIEERDGREVSHIQGMSPDGIRQVQIVPEGSAVYNPGFDITPARLVTALITEKGVCEASEHAIQKIMQKTKSERTK